MSDPAVKYVTRYTTDTGRFTGTGIIDFNEVPQPGEAFLAGHISNIREHRYDIETDAIVARLPLDATLSSTSITLGQSVTLSPLPVPCTVMIDGAEPVVVDDGLLEITPASIGLAYRLTVDHVMYLRTSYMFEVVDP